MSNYEKVLTAVKSIATTDEVIYEVLKSKKRNFIEGLVDLFLNNAMTVADALKQRNILFVLIANEDARIVEMNEQGVVSTKQCINSNLDKDGFKRVVVDGYVYKKYKKIL